MIVTSAIITTGPRDSRRSPVVGSPPMRPRHLVLLLAPLACAAPPALAPLAPLEVPPLVDHGLPLAPIDVEHLALEIRLDPGQRSIDASARLDFTARRDLERVELDLLGDLEVRWVTDPQGRGLAFEHAADRLVIALAEPLASGARGAVEVAYHGRPREGLWFSGADDAGPAHPGLHPTASARPAGAGFPASTTPRTASPARSPPRCPAPGPPWRRAAVWKAAPRGTGAPSTGPWSGTTPATWSPWWRGSSPWPGTAGWTRS